MLDEPERTISTMQPQPDFDLCFKNLSHVGLSIMRVCWSCMIFTSKKAACVLVFLVFFYKTAVITYHVHIIKTTPFSGSSYLQYATRTSEIKLTVRHWPLVSVHPKK